VNQVYVSGLHYTRPFVAQRELAVQPGDPLSQIDMLRTQQRLYDLGIFSQVDTAVQNPQGSESQKNVLVNTEEAKRYTFNYGLGLEFQTGLLPGGAQGETGPSARVSFGVTRLNFRGRNHTVSFKTNVGRLQQRALVSYEAPRWFNRRRLRLTITTFYDNTIDVTTFTSQRLEGSVRIDQILGDPEVVSKADTLRYQLTYRRVRADIASTITPDQIPLLSQPVRVGMPSLSYIRDRRDNPLNPTRGNYTTLDSGVGCFRLLRLGSRLQPHPGSELHLPCLRQEPQGGAEIRLCPLYSGRRRKPVPQYHQRGPGSEHPGWQDSHSAARALLYRRRQFPPRFWIEPGWPA
jgi:outer membrane protein assembly factor BamA